MDGANYDPSAGTDGLADVERMPLYDEIKAHVLVAVPPSRRPALFTALRSCREVFGRGWADRAFELEPRRIAETIRTHEANALTGHLTPRARANRRWALKCLAQVWVEVWRGCRPPASRARGLPKPEELFKFSNPAEETWGKANRRRAQSPYYLKALPPSVEDASRPFRDLRGEDSSGFVEVEALDGSRRKLNCKWVWTRPEGADKARRTASEGIYVECLRAVLGYASLPADGDDPWRKGLGVPIQDLRIAHFMLGDTVAKYIKFLAGRNGYTKNIDMAVLRWRMFMVGPNAYGRWAQRTLAEDVRAVLRDGAPRTKTAWLAWCGEQASIVSAAYAQLQRSQINRSGGHQPRFAHRHLKGIFSVAEPLEEVVWPTIWSLAEQRPGLDEPLRRRIGHERKIFTVVALTCAPLRRRVWSELRWAKHLSLEQGRWTIFVPRGLFKNRRALKADYCIDLPDDAQPFFTAWYELWKAWFKYDPLSPEYAAEISFVMAGFDTGPGTALHPFTLPQRLQFLKRMWGVHIGTHAFRHMVATDWLKRFPKDYITAAGLLYDTVGTVMKAYVHLEASDHVRRAHAANAGMGQRARVRLAATRRQNKEKHEGISKNSGDN